jgi:hypothetical protein
MKVNEKLSILLILEKSKTSNNQDRRNPRYPVGLPSARQWLIN